MYRNCGRWRIENSRQRPCRAIWHAPEGSNMHLARRVSSPNPTRRLTIGCLICYKRSRLQRAACFMSLIHSPEVAEAVTEWHARPLDSLQEECQRKEEMSNLKGHKNIVYFFHSLLIVPFHLSTMIKKKHLAYHHINYDSSFSMLSYTCTDLFLEKLLCTGIYRGVYTIPKISIQIGLSK